jgi:predicted Zn finger-like uncharacterized protein
MKLTCPNCGAGFEVSAEALGPTGRKVRCSACSTQWTARAEPAAPAPAPAPAATVLLEVPVAAPVVPAPAPSAPALPETTFSPLEPPAPEPEIPAEEVGQPDIAALREAAILGHSPPRPAAAAADEEEHESDASQATAQFVRTPPARAEARAPRRLGAILGWILFLLVLIAIGGAVWKREQVMAAFPQTREIFRSFGFNVPGPADGLDLVSPQPTWTRTTDGQPLLVVQGVVKNLSGATREIPPLRAILRDGTREVRAETFTASAARVEAGGEVPYRVEIRAPPQATTIAVVFSSAE